MPSNLPKSFSRPFLKVFHTILLVAITLATLFAMVEEFVHVFVERRVQLTDILLMFIYLEVLAMVQQFVMNGKIPVRYPIYIAMMAIARYITLGMKAPKKTNSRIWSLRASQLWGFLVSELELLIN